MREREVVYEPGEQTAGLAVSWELRPEPHKTQIQVEQLWPGEGDDGSVRVEPTYVGDIRRTASLISALGTAIEQLEELADE